MGTCNTELISAAVLFNNSGKTLEEYYSIS